MKSARRIIIGGLAALAAPAAYAQDGGSYVGAQMGINMLTDADTTRGAVVDEIEYDPGFTVLANYGQEVFDNVRLEGEVAFRRNTMDSFAGASAAGTSRLLTLMLNGYYDIDTGTKLTPYVGAGIGPGLSMFGLNGFNDRELTLAYQGIVGVAYELSEVVSIRADYRYLATLENKYEDNAARADSDYASHNVLIGFVYNFLPPRKAEPTPVAAPAPAPAPEPAPTPAPAPRNFMVFFDWDKAELTPEAQAILRDAAAYIKSGQTARLTVIGHADRSGGDRYNMRLSQRRADNVRDFLVRNGIGASAMEVVAKGESSPLVPTPDGVREPQNRRVEIVMP